MNHYIREPLKTMIVIIFQNVKIEILVKNKFVRPTRNISFYYFWTMYQTFQMYFQRDHFSITQFFTVWML